MGLAQRAEAPQTPPGCMVARCERLAPTLCYPPLSIYLTPVELHSVRKKMGGSYATCHILWHSASREKRGQHLETRRSCEGTRKEVNFKALTVSNILTRINFFFSSPNLQKQPVKITQKWSCSVFCPLNPPPSHKALCTWIHTKAGLHSGFINQINEYEPWTLSVLLPPDPSAHTKARGSQMKQTV